MILMNSSIPTCDYCKRANERVLFHAICRRGRLEVHEAWLHPECEQAYLMALDGTDPSVPI